MGSLSIIERKICYDGTIAEYNCVLLEETAHKRILFHHVVTPFVMKSNIKWLSIPKNSYTIASYFTNKPYNFYYWLDENGTYLGAYFNIVRHTNFTNKAVEFEDLILDILVFPDGDYAILDEDELPEPLALFEKGIVQAALQYTMLELRVALQEITEHLSTFQTAINRHLPKDRRIYIE